MKGEPRRPLRGPRIGRRSGGEERYDPAISVIQMQYFCTVMRMGSLSRAAELLFVTPEAVSAQIRKLEEGLGVKLVSHQRGRWIPTLEGRQFLHRAEEILRQLHDLEQSLTQHAKKPRLRIWAARSPGVLWIPNLVARYRLAEQWDVEVRTALSREVLQAVAAGAADVGVVGLFNEESEIAAARRDLHLNLERLGADEMVAAMKSPLEGWERRTRISYAKLATLGPLIFLEDMPLRGEMERHLRRLGVFYERRVLSNDFQAILAMVAAGVGIGILPELSVTSWPHPPLTLYRLDPPLVRGLYWVTREGEAGRWEEIRQGLVTVAEPSPAAGPAS